MKAKQKKILDLLIIAGISVALVGLLEVLTRVYYRVTSGKWSETRQELFHREMQTGISLLRLHPFMNTSPQEGSRAVAFGKEISFNSLGYRSPERPWAKSGNGVLRILCSGGSTTLDMLAADDETSWPWLLEQRLREENLQVEVWNSSMPAWSSMENTISLLVRDVDLEPDIIVLYQGINDLRAASLQPFDRQYEGHARQVRQVSGFHIQPLVWHEKSLLLEKLRDVVKGPEDPRRRLGIEHSGERLPEILDQGVEVFARNVLSFIGIGRSRGAAIVLATQMIRVREEFAAEAQGYLGGMFPGLVPGNAVEQLERLNDVLRKLAAENEGVLLADAARDISWGDADFGDPMHFSRGGSEKFVEFIESIVVTGMKEAYSTGQAIESTATQED